MPTAFEEYIFDLRSYICRRNAVGAAHLAELNTLLDTYLDQEPDTWKGWVYRAPGRGPRYGRTRSPSR